MPKKEMITEFVKSDEIKDIREAEILADKWLALMKSIPKKEPKKRSHKSKKVL